MSMDSTILCQLDELNELTLAVLDNEIIIDDYNELISTLINKIKDIKIIIDLQSQTPTYLTISGKYIGFETAHKLNKFDTNYPEIFELYLSLSKPVCDTIFNRRQILNNLTISINRDNQLRRAQCYYIVKSLIRFSLQQPAQRSPEWHIKRGNYITASQVANALDENKYSSRLTSLQEKCGILPRFVGNEATDFGTKYEPLATIVYQRDINKWWSENSPPNTRTSIHIEESAFIRCQDPRYVFLGGSPDGLVIKRTDYLDDNNNVILKTQRDGYGIEIKCPLRRWPKGEVPHHYWIQMQIQLEATNLEKVYFLDFKFHESNDFESFCNSTKSYEYKRKGAVIEFITQSRLNKNNELVEDVTTHYSDTYEPSVNNNIISDWVEKVIKSEIDSACVIRVCVRYWTLSRSYYTRVERDRTWLAKNAHKIIEYWNDYAYYSAHPHELENNYGDDDEGDMGIIDEYVINKLQSLEKKLNN